MTEIVAPEERWIEWFEVEWNPEGTSFSNPGPVLRESDSRTWGPQSVEGTVLLLILRELRLLREAVAPKGATDG